MKKLLTVLLSVLMMMSLVGCSSNKTTEAEGSVLSVCIASEPDTIDPALNSAVDGATLVAHLFQGLAKWAQDANGNLVIVADAAEELVEPTENADGTVTYVYTLREGLKWSDGQDLKASDFAFAWQRAIEPETAADYEYMFDVVDGYADGKLNVVADDTARTITVTTNGYVAYWNELLSFPTYYPVRADVVANEAWATDPSTYVCNGPYYIADWAHSSMISLKKNPNFIDADKITMDQIDFYLSDDANTMLANFQNGSWLMIDDVPTEEIATLKADYPTEFVVAGQIGTYYVIFNVNENLSAAGKELSEVETAEVRNALGLLFDRNYIVEEIGQAGQVPASSFVAMGMTDADGSQFYENAGHNDGFVGYYDTSKEAFESNIATALETLKKYYTFDEASGAFTDFPTMTYLYNTLEGHKRIGEYLQSALAAYGITMNLENQEWNTFLNTRKNGDYSIARNGWLADYNDPITFIDMWYTSSGNNDAQFGKGAHETKAVYSLDLTDLGLDVKVENGTWAQTYDVVVKLIKECKDATVRMELLHRAEDLLMSTGCIVPLYFYTDIYMISDKVSGFFSNPLGYKYFMNTTIAD